MNLQTLRSLTNTRRDGSGRWRIVEITEEGPDGKPVTRKVMKPRDRSKYMPGHAKDRGTR